MGLYRLSHFNQHPLEHIAPSLLCSNVQWCTALHIPWHRLASQLMQVLHHFLPMPCGCAIKRCPLVYYRRLHLVTLVNSMHRDGRKQQILQILQTAPDSQRLLSLSQEPNPVLHVNLDLGLPKSNHVASNAMTVNYISRLKPHTPNRFCPIQSRSASAP